VLVNMRLLSDSLFPPKPLHHRAFILPFAFERLLACRFQAQGKALPDLIRCLRPFVSNLCSNLISATLTISCSGQIPE